MGRDAHLTGLRVGGVGQGAARPLLGGVDAALLCHSLQQRQGVIDKSGNHATSQPLPVRQRNPVQ